MQMGLIMQKKLCLLIICIASFLISGCPDSKDDYRIGAIFVLSDQSDEEFINEHQVLTGMEVAVNKINEEGGVRGRKLSLIVRDCERDSVLASKQALEVMEYDPVVVISIYSHISKAIIPVATKHGFTHVAALSTAENIFKNATHSFRYGPWASKEVESALPIMHKLSAKKIALVNIDNIYGNSVSDQLAALANSEGIATQKIVYNKIGSELEVKLRGMQDLDLIYFSCFPEDVSGLVKMFKKVFPGLPIIAPQIVASPTYAKRPELDGVYVAAPLIYNSEFPFIADTNNYFMKETNEALTHYSAIGYDLVNLLAQLIGRSDESPPALTRELFSGFVYPGLFGDVVNESGSNEFSFPLYPAQIQGGSLVYQER